MDLSNAQFLELVVEGKCSANLTLCGIPYGAVPVWFEIPDELADHFMLTDFKVGGIGSQFISTGAIPASLFARGAPRDELLLDPVGLRGSLTISVTNLNESPASFGIRVVFSNSDTRLARYRRARVEGLGLTRISPNGCGVVVVQPSWSLIPDRLFVPPNLLRAVDVQKLEIFTWYDVRGAGDLVESVSPEYLTPANLLGDGLLKLPRSSATVGREKCFAVTFQNKTNVPVDVSGAILGGEPLL